jgi:RNA polymerase sigma-70 factor (ECF subfamily)
MPDWQEILARDGSVAWQTAYRLLGNWADADDCFQEACLSALRFSERQEVHDWRALLQHLATLRAMDHLRARNRASPGQRQRTGDELPDRTPSPIQNAQEAELASELRLALSHIPGKQAEVFCLHCLEDWSYEEIARHARLSVTAVGVLLHRARKRLRGLLGSFREEAAMPIRVVPPGGSQQATAVERKEHS